MKSKEPICAYISIFQVREKLYIFQIRTRKLMRRCAAWTADIQRQTDGPPRHIADRWGQMRIQIWPFFHCEVVPDSDDVQYIRQGLRNCRPKNGDEKYLPRSDFVRVADPVHFRPDPDPANQNLKNRIRILLALTKNQLKHLNFFHIKHISSDRYLNGDYFYLKNGKIHLKMWKSSI